MLCQCSSISVPIYNFSYANKVSLFNPFSTPDVNLTSNFSKVVYSTANDATELQQEFGNEILVNNPSRSSPIKNKTRENVCDKMSSSDVDEDKIPSVNLFKSLYCMGVCEK